MRVPPPILGFWPNWETIMGDDSSSKTVHRLWRARRNHYGDRGKSHSHSRTDKRSLPPCRAARPAPPRARPVIRLKRIYNF